VDVFARPPVPRIEDEGLSVRRGAATATDATRPVIDGAIACHHEIDRRGFPGPCQVNRLKEIHRCGIRAAFAPFFLAGRCHQLKITDEAPCSTVRSLTRICFIVMNFPDPNLPPILIVDDCEDDVFLLRHRLRAGEVANPIRAFSSAEDALNYLRYLPWNEATPYLLFTDIKMPGGCGFDLIGKLREEPRWDSMKIAVITSSNHPVDLERALDLGVNGYLIKFPPPDLLAEFTTKGPWFAVSSRVHALTHPLSA
jgi:CheY-like chemotaxis protein